MKNPVYWLLGLCLTLFFITPSHAQEKVTLSGYMKDASNGESMIGASVYVKELKGGTTTNVYGFYSITLPKGTYNVTYSYVGYSPKTEQITLNANLTKSIELGAATTQMQEVIVSAERKERQENVTSTQMSVNKMEMKTIKQIPAVFGEVDVIRAVQLLPGVTTVGEGATGFNVRGGSVDHNLILLDEAPVYNSSHLMGFFSVFNPDAVKDLKLYKGGIPAAYGGRLASLLDIRMKEGNTKKTQVSGGIGTVMTRLSVEGPIKKDKISYVVAARRSYIDVLAKPFLKKDLAKSRLFFYDLSGKINYKIDDKNTVFVSGYAGRDVMRFGDEFQFNWGNATGTLRWNHIFNQKLFANFTTYYSNYDYSLGVPSGAQEFKWVSNIVNHSAKADFNYYITPDNTFNFGASAIRYTFKPGKVTGGGESIFTSQMLPNQQALEYAVYGSDEYKASARLSFHYGLRFSMFNYRGNKDTLFTYKTVVEGEEKPVDQKNLDYMGKYESVKLYNNFEPRFSINYALDERTSLKASYNRTAQYIHLISNSTAATPLDVWTPSTNNLKPQIADQVALGIFKNLGEDDDYETSAEVYYKTMQNQIDYINGAELLLNRNLEGQLLSGKGRAYGLELYVKKNTGKLTGWISYTLSRTERQVNGINNNEWYVSKFDRPHNLVVVGMYELNDKWSLSATFTYATGTPVTFPNSRYEIDGLIVAHNSNNSRNADRIPAYHRLDFGATRKANISKKYQGELVFSVYNVYARRNPFSISVQQKINNDKDASPYITEAHRISIFGSFIPSITYNFKF